MIIVPVRGDNTGNSRCDGNTDLIEIPESDWNTRLRIEAGVNDHPRTVPEMTHGAFPETRTEKRKLDLVSGRWIQECGSIHSIARQSLPDRRATGAADA